MIFFRCDHCGAEFKVKNFGKPDEGRAIPTPISYLYKNELFFTDGKAPCHFCREKKKEET